MAAASSIPLSGPEDDCCALFALTVVGLGADVALRGADIERAHATLHRWLDRVATRKP